jgi:hypothetical protein
MGASFLTSTSVTWGDIFTLMAVLGRNHCALIVSLVLTSCLEDIATVNIDIVLLHELAQLRKAVGGVNLGHVDSTKGRRSVESSGDGE